MQEPEHLDRAPELLAQLPDGPVKRVLRAARPSHVIVVARAYLALPPETRVVWDRAFSGQSLDDSKKPG